MALCLVGSQGGGDVLNAAAGEGPRGRGAGALKVELGATTALTPLFRNACVF